ncbi:MAG TPA: hypothetical protein VFK48_09085, partial [Usitatibacter sp.]|nr:hypothetical protein [Usitatibacter sp.]
GFLHGFANTTDGAWNRMVDGFGERWVSEAIAFKPYACGTMIHPYIDCARRIVATGQPSPRPSPKGEGAASSPLPWEGAGGGSFDAITRITCDTAEGIVHRLWEPLAAKRRPPNAYAAKFSVPFCVAYAMLRGHVGLEAFTDETARDPQIAALAAKVGYRVDPANPYPDAFTGHVRVEMRDGRVLEERQPHFRGGASEPLTRAEIEEKFRANCACGGWDSARAQRWLEFARGAFDARAIDLEEFRA